MKSPLFPHTAIPGNIRTVFASFSGGADSLALLLTLAEHAKTAAWDLRAVHFEHGIRGTESLSDAEFCRTVCQALGVPFQIVSLDVPAKIRPGEGIEAAARRLRITAWGPIVAEAEKQPAAVALGHHEDDRIETLFLRLLRGSNSSGLNGLRPARIMNDILWLRPMLHIQRREIEQFLTDCPFQCRTDSTNLQNDYARNRLRNLVLPELYRQFPHAAAGLASALDALAEDADFLDASAKNALDQIDQHDGTLSLSGLAALHPALLPRVLRLWLSSRRREDFVPDRALITRLQTMLNGPEACQGTKHIPMAGGGKLLLMRNHVAYRMDPDPEAAPCTMIWLYQTVSAIRFGRTVLRYHGIQADPELPTDAESAVFDPEAMPSALLVSSRGQGDTMTPFGAHSPRSLKKVLTDAHISALDQPLRPVVRSADAPELIFWVPGIRRAAAAPVRSGAAGMLFTSERLIDVTAAVIMGRDGRILVCSRPEGKHMAGKWEFPGGKIEPGETGEACIEREIREELGMRISVGPVLDVMEHDYGIKYVRVTFYAAKSQDEPEANDHQNFMWTTFDALPEVAFLDADRPFALNLQKNRKNVTDLYNNIADQDVIWVSKQPDWKLENGNREK